MEVDIPKIMFDPAKLKLVDPKSLKKDPKNRNKHSEQQIELFCKLLKTYGMRWPILVSERTGVIKAGEGRLLAALKLKMPQVLVSYQEFDNDEIEYGFGISDNAIAAWAELDLSAINTDIIDLGPGFDIELLGMQDFSIDPPSEKPEKEELTVEQSDLLNQAWAQWCSEQLINISLLEKQRVFFQSLTPASLKIYFLRSLFLGEKFPRFITTSRQYHRMLCSGDGDGGSIVDLLHKISDRPDLAARLRFSLQEKPSFEKLASVCGIPMAGHKAPLDFPVELARDLYNEFAKDGEVLDPCHGWGGRYLGFLLSEANSYTGYDPSEMTHEGLSAISDDLQQYHDKDSLFICLPYEDSGLEDSKYDFALTSPPYFDRERYIGGDQAHTRYKTYEYFIEGFYRALIFKTFKALRSGSCFALQVGNQVYDLDIQARRIALAAGFELIETRETQMKGVGAETSDEASEVILLFRKC